MKSKFLASAASITLVLATTTGASLAADPIDTVASSPGHEWYISLFGGGAFFDNYDFNFVNGGTFPYTVDLEDSYIVGGAVGINNLFVENLRGEVELSYMRTDPDGYTAPGFVGINPQGHISSVNLMANIWYAFDTGTAFKPYVGGGIGAGFASGSLTIDNGAGDQFDGDDVGFAYQIGGGIQWDVSSNVAIDVGYRYRGVTDVQFDSSIAGFTTSSGDINAHTVQGALIFKLP